MDAFYGRRRTRCPLAPMDFLTGKI
jgi:hypothetical protein